MEHADLRTRAAELPKQPGVYQFYDDDTILYIGKAVDLRDRVRSYTDPRNNRIRQMVDRATRIEFVVTDTEKQALLLESNLIKRHQPRYNVRLKDDKSYPLVQFTNHSIPRIEITRNPDEAATVFGPFSRQDRVEVVVKAIRQTYGLRGCSDHKYEGRERPCLDYDIGLCTAPCTGEITEDEYAADVESVTRFFEGETGVLTDPIRDAMEAAADAQQFERAANLRDRLDVIEAFHGDGEDVIHEQRDAQTMDSLGVAFDGDQAIVARLHSDRGQLVDRSRHTLETPETNDISAVLEAFIVQYYAERTLPETVLLPVELTDGDVHEWLENEGVTTEVPGTGRHNKLVELAMKNARTRPNTKDNLAELADRLALSSVERIEGFDVSHSQGKAVVGSNVLFVDGESETDGYRRKKLTEQNDDYDNMYELVRWRASRAIEERDARPDPDLLLIDGGRGQLSAARDALADVGWDVPAVGLAKDEEIVVTPEREYDWESDAGHLQVLQQVRDEAHRFAVQYHQSLRDDVTTTLDAIDGIGPETRQKLLRRFGGIDQIREASIEELQDIEGIGEGTAETIQSALQG